MTVTEDERGKEEEGREEEGAYINIALLNNMILSCCFLDFRTRGKQDDQQQPSKSECNSSWSVAVTSSHSVPSPQDLRLGDDTLLDQVTFTDPQTAPHLSSLQQAAVLGQWSVQHLPSHPRWWG